MRAVEVHLPLQARTEVTGLHQPPQVYGFPEASYIHSNCWNGKEDRQCRLRVDSASSEEETPQTFVGDK